MAWCLFKRKNNYILEELRLHYEALSGFITHPVNLRLPLLARGISSTMKETTRSPETSVYDNPTQRHIRKDYILHSQSREHLKSYNYPYGRNFGFLDRN
jgi:hypothetical protein